MNERMNIATHWEIAPRTVQRVWPLIDVYGRVERALRSQGARVVPNLSVLSGNGSAA